MPRYTMTMGVDEGTVIDGIEIDFTKEIEVTFFVTPGEDAILYPNDLAHPGCDASIEIEKITEEQPDMSKMYEFKTVDVTDEYIEVVESREDELMEYANEQLRSEYEDER